MERYDGERMEGKTRRGERDEEVGGVEHSVIGVRLIFGVKTAITGRVALVHPSRAPLPTFIARSSRINQRTIRAL